MKYKIEKILSQFRKEIKAIEASDLNDFSNVEQGIRICQEHLQKLRLVLRESTFKNKQEEIKFFKEHKPHVYGQLKFYVKLYKFLMHRPMGSIKSQRNYIDSLIKKLQTDNQKNIDFVKYYREQSTLLDKFLFFHP
ncbi:RteC domain-containing protein [Flagellimonas sp.]|uniref:RteC domain-containing protein n=1 Tax=Flagellimonas sp. TaxID=2058762 RepID=UPI003AB8528C